MKDFNRYKKKTEKLLKRWFGYKTIAIALKAKENLRKEIEAITDSKIDNIDYKIIREKRLWSEYAEYKTLEGILGAYIDSTIINLFGGNNGFKRV